MYAPKRCSAVTISLPICLFLLASAAASAAPPSIVGIPQPPVHFLSDRFQFFNAKPMLPAPGGRFEHIPKTYLIFGLRAGTNGRMVCTDRLGHPLMSFPMPKCRLVKQAGH